MPSHSASKTLDAIVHNSSWTAHSGFAFLSAEILVPNADTIPPFVGQSDRNRHDRTGMHFGEQSAATVLISDAVGSIPAGSSLDDVLRYLWNIVVDRESILGGRFTLDAELLEFLYFWKDSMQRVVAVDMGTSSGASDFGPFDWQRYDADGGLSVEVNGLYVQMTANSPADFSDFTGYPTFTRGEFRASIYTFHTDTAEWHVSWRPWRDDIADVDVWLHREFVSGAWRMTAGIGSTISTFLPINVTQEDFNVRFLCGAPGEPIAIKLWNWEDDSEPLGYDVTGTMPAPTTNILPVFHVDNVGTPILFMILNDFKAIKTDTDPARRYYNLRLDSWVGTPATTITQTFTADAIARARIAGSFLLDALAKAVRTSSKTLDAVIKAARNASLTLDANVDVSTSQSFTLNGITLAHRTGSFVLDALARATRSSSFTLDASTPTPIDGYDAGSGYNIGTYDGEGTPFYLDALIRHTFPASFTLDAGVAAPNDALYDSPTDTYTSSGKYDQPFFTLDAIVA